MSDPITVACWALLSMEFSRQEYWSGLPCPPPGDFPNPGIEPTSLMSPALAGWFFTTSTTWEAYNWTEHALKKYRVVPAHKYIVVGLPQWPSGYKSALQYKGHYFDPWFRKIPHAAEQLCLCATTTEPALEPMSQNYWAHVQQLLKLVHRQPMFCNKRSRCSEKPAHHNKE